MAESDRDKLMKILALALDQVGKPEGDLAAVMFVKQLRATGHDVSDIIWFKNDSPKAEEHTPSSGGGKGKLSEEFLKKVTFPFGKHKKKRMWDVVQENRDYMVWASENITFREAKMNDAVAQILELFPDEGDSDYEGGINLGD